ncbi:MAG: tetratricopeptide repeat protein [Gemmatimonadota bacterium]
MKFRTGFALLASLTLVAGGCASTGGGPGAGDPDAPQETELSRNATLFLSQAQLTGDEAEQNNRYQQALEAAQAGIAADSAHALSYLLAGQALIGLGQTAEADDFLTEAVALYDGYAQEVEAIREEAWIEAYNEGVDALGTGDEQAAQVSFERGHEIYQERPEAMIQLGTMYVSSGEHDLAIERFGQAVDVILEKAEEQDEETRAFWMENLEPVAFNRAQLLAQQGRYNEAETAYRNFLERDPDNIGAISNLAVVLVNKGDSAGAEQIYSELMSRPGMTAEDFFVTGIGLFQVESFEQAARAFGEAHRLNPQSRDAIYNYAQTLYLAEDFESLVEIEDALLTADAFNENAYRLVAQSHLQTGDQQTAVQFLERMQALPFDLSQTQLQPMAGGGARISGMVTTLSGEPGSQFRIRFTFMDPAGTDLGSTEVTGTLPAQEESVAVQGEWNGEGRVTSFRYEVLSH